VSLIKEQLREYLNTGDIITLAKAERQVSFEVIFQTKSKPFCRVKDERQLYSSSEDRLLLGSGGENELPKDTRFCDLAKSILSHEKEKIDKIYENAENTKRVLQDLEIHWNKQMKLVEEGSITEEQAIINLNKYRVNYPPTLRDE
jgi:hypothetical protein